MTGKELRPLIHLFFFYITLLAGLTVFVFGAYYFSATAILSLTGGYSVPPIVSNCFPAMPEYPSSFESISDTGVVPTSTDQVVVVTEPDAVKKAELEDYYRKLNLQQIDDYEKCLKEEKQKNNYDNEMQVAYAVTNLLQDGTVLFLGFIIVLISFILIRRGEK